MPARRAMRGRSVTARHRPRLTRRRRNARSRARSTGPWCAGWWSCRCGRACRRAGRVEGSRRGRLHRVAGARGLDLGDRVVGDLIAAVGEVDRAARTRDGLAVDRRPGGSRPSHFRLRAIADVFGQGCRRGHGVASASAATQTAKRNMLILREEAAIARANISHARAADVHRRAGRAPSARNALDKPRPPPYKPPSAAPEALRRPGSSVGRACD